MRVVVSSILAGFCAASVAAATLAHAQTGPVIVVPGKAGVPVIINEVVADGAVVYGDWGLARPGHGEVVVEGLVAYAQPWDSRGYFSATGRAPRYGRHEILAPKNPRPRPTNFRRDWSISSEFQVPVTEYPPFDPPPVVLAPRQRHR